MDKNMNLREETIQLLQEAGPGRMMNTAYDTAWVARLGELDKSISYQALEWVCEHQLPDGSWGASDAKYYHDRTICTLAAMTAIARRGKRAQDRLQIERGKIALENLARGATKGLTGDPNGATIGFELIMPTLLAEAESLGIIHNHHGHVLERIRHQRDAKLALWKGQTINRYMTMAFSAEMAGTDRPELFDLESLQEANGSIGYSPSATAYFAIYLRPQDPAALEYLRRSMFQGGVPNATPFEVFERSWVLWNLALVGSLDAETLALCQPHLDFLEAAWKPGEGVRFAVGYTPTDGDDTDIAYTVLRHYGRSVGVNAIFAYEKEKHFQCFKFEVNPSISTNVHALGALRQAGLEVDHPSIQKILKFLLETRKAEGYWFDKWHASPYYPTAHAIITLAGYQDDLAIPAVDWLLKTQRKEGSWGSYFASAEETAYCLQALLIWHLSGKRVPTDKIRQAVSWLEDHAGKPYPPLWIGKCLYSPELVVHSAVLSALLLANKTGLV